MKYDFFTHADDVWLEYGDKLTDNYSNNERYLERNG
jgi:hypothetical protein